MMTTEEWNDMTAGEEREVILKAKWKPCVHGGGWWVARDADGVERLLAPDGFVDQLAPADLAQAPAPVRVKGLQWDDFGDYGAKAQAWNQANYMIQKWSDGRWEISASYPGYSTFIEGTDRFYPTLEAAKAAAQQDYEQRILAALEAPDAGVVAELVEALRKLTKCQTIGDINASIDTAHAVLAKWDALALIAHNTTEG